MVVLSGADNLKDVEELRMVFSCYFILSTVCLSMFVTHTETHPDFVLLYFRGVFYFSTSLKSISD